ncbi:MAG: FAD-binding protein, partial [Pseudomonadota bacterium]
MGVKPLKSQHIAVIGGGLGGLCAALCFARRGASVEVREQAAAFTEVGAGIQVASNGLRVLRALGLDPSSAFQAAGTTLHDHWGRRVAVLPNGPRREVRLFHRAELLRLLEDGCRAA